MKYITSYQNVPNVRFSWWTTMCCCVSSRLLYSDDNHVESEELY
jgi:hypothetical protein